MWMTGGYPNASYDPTCQIGYAVSIDGIKWSVYPDIVLPAGDRGTWDSVGIETVCVIKDTSAYQNERYKMWYCGYDSHEVGSKKIGYATSPDGINWTKYPGNPVLKPDPYPSYDFAGIWNPMVIKDGDTYKMWYPSIGVVEEKVVLPICYATSSDGINWVKYPGNPVLLQGEPGSWDDTWVCEPSVLKRNGIYEMWYSGASQEGAEEILPYFNTGYATSVDGINWEKHGIVLEHGEPGDWDAWTAFAVTVIFENDTYKMWYTGIDTFNPYPTFWSIGYATSTEGVNTPPATPNRPSGPTSGKIGEKYTYTTSAVDQDGDKIKYGWDWDGDQIVDEWTKLYDSGATIETTHSWDEKGTYEIRVKAMDEHGSESDWSEPLTVSIPKTHNIWNLIKQISDWFMKTFRRNIIQDFGG
jgi:predicted GH43/DUF377 family glycosyl hydrolase